jgi:hypothetical protein
MAVIWLPNITKKADEISSSIALHGPHLLPANFCFLVFVELLLDLLILSVREQVLGIGLVVVKFRQCTESFVVSILIDYCSWKIVSLSGELWDVLGNSYANEAIRAAARFQIQAPM